VGLLHASTGCVRIFGRFAQWVRRAGLRLLKAKKSWFDFMCSLEKVGAGEQMKHHQPFIGTFDLRVARKAEMMEPLSRRRVTFHG
jgi:hypothetical protein